MPRYERWIDDDLALAFRAGDLAAGEALLTRYARFVYAVCSQFGVDDQDAGDIFSEVWLKLQRQIVSYEYRTGFRAYLRVVVKSVIIDQARRRRRHDGHLSFDCAAEEGEPELGELLPAEVDVEQALLDKELLDLVQRAVRLLPDRFREPLELYYRDGLGHQTIAERLQMPKNTVTTRIHRGREQVRRQVLEWLHEDPRSIGNAELGVGVGRARP
ncbi:MAG: sigma-70 family RNA polymerase sigma factor [Fimbriimonadaceae bacterium]|nr:sigma-70 family RNA polymerase sigma factor [Fimbriimonadaceae bacterium]